jgi:predicted transposase/invertase (TIGR01784 family)
MTIFDEIEQEGIKQGIEQGIKKEKQNTIIRSWQNGLAIPMISNITGVSIAEIKKVIADFQSKI